MPHVLTFTLYNVAENGSSLWSTTRSVSVEGGYYSVALGGVPDTPFDSLIFDDDLWLQVSVDETDFARMFLHSVPFAARAATATSLRGGTVDALEVQSAGLVRVGQSEQDCTSSLSGSLRYISATGLLQFCNGASWSPVGGDGIPDPFTIAAGGAGPSTLATSAAVTLLEYDVPITVTVTGDGSPEVRMGSGSWGTSGTLVVGGTFYVRATVPATPGQSSSVDVVAGGAATTWIATAGDVIPDTFTFADGVGEASSVVTAGPLTLSGYEYTTSVSVSGEGNPQIRVGSGSWTTSSALGVGEQLWVRTTTPSVQEQVSTVTINAGGTLSTWNAGLGYNEEFLKTIATPAGIFHIAVADTSSQSCNDACSARGLSCNESDLTALQAWASPSTSNFHELIVDLLELTFTSGAPIPTPMNTTPPYFGLGCSSGTRAFTGFSSAITGCSNALIRHSNPQSMSCSHETYTNGNFSGPRICTCD